MIFLDEGCIWVTVHLAHTTKRKYCKTLQYNAWHDKIQECWKAKLSTTGSSTISTSTISLWQQTFKHMQKFQQYLIKELHWVYRALGWKWGLLFLSVSFHTSGNVAHMLTRRSKVRACPNTHTCSLGLLRVCTWRQECASLTQVWKMPKLKTH